MEAVQGLDKFPANHKGSLGKTDQSWLALLAQENITGVDINVQAQFVASKLVGWLVESTQECCRWVPGLDPTLTGSR